MSVLCISCATTDLSLRDRLELYRSGGETDSSFPDPLKAYLLLTARNGRLILCSSVLLATRGATACRSPG
jgi:hypothetical protein